MADLQADNHNNILVDGLRYVITTACEQRSKLYQHILKMHLYFSLLFVILTPVYQLKVNLEELSKVLTTASSVDVNAIRPEDFLFMKNTLEEQAQLSMPHILVFRNFLIVFGFIMVLWLTYSNDSMLFKTTSDVIVNNILFGIFIWSLLCLNIALPLQFTLTSNMSSFVDYIRNPFYSLWSVVVYIFAVPFSLTERPPLVFSSEESAKVIAISSQFSAGRIKLPENLEFQRLYTISYNWWIILPLTIFISSLVTIVLNEESKEKTEAFSLYENEMIQPGNVHRLSKTFEDKSNRNRLSNTSLKKQRPKQKTEEDKITTTTILTRSKPKAAVALAKIRPVNVTKPLQVHLDSTAASEQPSEASFTNNNSLKTMRIQSGFATFPDPINKQDDSERGKESITLAQKMINKTNDAAIQCSPETTECSQQADATEYLDKEQQHAGTSTQEATQQTDGVLTVDQSVHCEILSQERFTKLQQSALALYKKNVEKKDTYTWSTLPRKIDLSSKVIKQINKSVQVNLARIQDDGTVDINEDLTCLQSASGDLTVAESQTDLSGYVLEKILQDRDTGNAYSKMDVEKTVHSVLKLSEKVKQHTDTIRFKAMKSQHGVWYVSLRGDIFLTVSQDILRTAKLREEHKMAGEVSADILRAMKQFVDNYNKLSDFFDDEVESDDESFINGFRL